MSLVRHVVQCTRPGSNSVWRIRIHLQFERWYAPEMARKGFEGTFSSGLAAAACLLPLALGLALALSFLPICQCLPM